MRFGARAAWAALLVGLLQVPALLGAPNSPDPAEANPPVDNSTARPSSTPKSSTSSNGTGTTLNSITTTSKMSASTTPVTTKPTLQTTTIPQNTSKITTSAMTTTRNSSVTSVSSSVTVTATINSKENKGSKFDIGSFVGGIVLTLGVLSILYIGCKTYYSRRGIRYRTIDEHDAII